MNEWLKNGFFLGLGAAVAGKEKVQTYLDDLVSKGRITPKEAEEFAENLIQKGETKEDEWSQASKERVQGMFHDMGLATSDDIENLEAKINHLEKMLEQNADNNNA
ncbi:phasin family protein [Natribacillus halophilus]|uniref:Polyhydroxyalkanoate synthesis regulator phasin n=1 Tax=Natribacillus halophilus TaxID=549003 RepID=A0A1G8J9E7_9BACI|nr:phasin family protein [Natribacillus halophilus]SDI27816.1 Polyhydroxyalkanoate synthesis regulator phasin [Natribacillus halophilus]